MSEAKQQPKPHPKPESDALFLHKFCGRRLLPYSLEEKKLAVQLLHLGYSKAKIVFSLRFSYHGSAGVFSCASIIDRSELTKRYREKHKEQFKEINRLSTLRRETCKIVQGMHPETRKLYAKLVRGVPDEEILGVSS